MMLHTACRFGYASQFAGNFEWSTWKELVECFDVNNTGVA